MRKLWVLVLLAALAGSATAQAVLYGPSTTRTFQSSYAGAHTFVRDSQANLYVIYRYAVNTLTQWDIAIGRSTDGGKTWNMTWQKSFAQLSTHFGNYHPCIAIDSKNNLHCAWYHRVAFTGSRLPPTIRYIRFDAATGKFGTESKMNPTAVYERPNPVLAVDGNDYVWFSYSNTGWDSVLARSDKTFASDSKFSTFTPAFVAGNSQHVSLVADKQNRIHITYYDTGGGYAGVKHQWIDPAATTPKWTLTALSNHGPTNHTSRAEYHSRLTSDFWGNVYAIYNVDDQAPSSSRNGNTETYVRKWDGASQAWGKPVLVQSVKSSVWVDSNGANDGRMISCAVDEGAGELYFVYRDFTTGDFRLARWNGDDTAAPTTFAKLMNTKPLPANARNYFFVPHFRGTLWPTSNRTAFGLDVTYVVGDQHATTPSYIDFLERFPLGSLSSVEKPQIGTTYKMDLTAVSDGGKVYVTALCVAGLGNSIAVDRRFMPLLPDAFFYVTASNALPTVFQNFTGIMSKSGTAQVAVVIPGVGGLVGVKAYVAYLTAPGGVNGIHTVSNPWAFTIEK